MDQHETEPMIDQKQYFEDRGERLCDSVFDVAQSIAAQEGGKRFSAKEVCARLPDLKPTQVHDSIKVLRDQQRVIGLGGGQYELADVFPPARKISVSRTSDGWYMLEVDGRHRLMLTETEYRYVGGFTGGFAAQTFYRERLDEVEGELRLLRRRIKREDSPL